MSSGYRLSSGDQIRIITFNEPGLSGEFGIDDSGYVALPLLGTVSTEGLTTRELAAKLSAVLKERKLLNDPSVAVEGGEVSPGLCPGRSAASRPVSICAAYDDVERRGIGRRFYATRGQKPR